jgi:hypothetical protein
MKSRTLSSVLLLMALAASPALGQFNGGGLRSNPSAPGSVPSNGFWITPSSFQWANHQNFAGIGAVKSNVDLLSNPARFQRFPTPICPTPNPCFPRPCLSVNPLNESILFRPHDPQLFQGGTAFVTHDRAFTEAGGFSADGRWHGKDWWVRFHLGSGYTTWPGNGALCNNVAYPAYGYRYPGYYPYAYPYYDYSYADYYAPPMQPVYQQPPMPQPPQAQPVPKTPPSDLEIGLSDMSAGDWDAAITRLRKHLKTNVNDNHAVRYLAVALLETKKFDDASALMRQAYRGEPALAGEPIPAADLGIGETELRRLVSSTVLYAHRVNSASSWLTVAVLMQAEGREKVAGTMLERAQKQGLEQIILDPLKGALTQ